MSVLRWPFVALIVFLQIGFLLWFTWAAYDIRTHAVKTYGYIIHEFDPWFNYRAAEYLAEHGREKFFKWYDYESWYPLGRSVGTTIYPGMQFTAVWIWEAMKYVPAFTWKFEYSESTKDVLRAWRGFLKRRGFLYFPPTPKLLEFSPWSVNDICVMIPAWFGSIQALFGGLLAYEATRSVNAGICAVGIMAFIPANLSRSIAGCFDNECVAVTAILMTFWLWTRSVRNPSSWTWGFFAALSYINMVACWGGYIFVLNTIGVHALILVGLGRFNSGVHKAYTIFYVIGTFGAMQIPVVGWTPLRSLEQIGPLGVFLGYQVLGFCDYQRRTKKMKTSDFVKMRIGVFVLLILGLVAAGMILAPMGYFGPLSSRIRGLFVKHTKTGNPLVDSVAEHQPANAAMYGSHLHWPLGFVMPATIVLLFNRTNAAYFLGVYGYVAMHFSLKMSRLLMICGPITAIMCGIWFGFVLDFILEPFFLFLGKQYPKDHALFDVTKNVVEKDTRKGSQEADKESKDDKKAAGKKGSKENKVEPPKKSKNGATNSRLKTEEDWGLNEWDEDFRPGGFAQMKRMAKHNFLKGVPSDLWNSVCTNRHKYRQDSSWRLARVALSCVLVVFLINTEANNYTIAQFLHYADRTAQGMSSPTVVKMLRNGQIMTDAMDGYHWLEQNTPKESRVFAWWDYGYQITGIAKRTSLADGNTWNHEHIATLGRLLSGGQKSSHSVIRHLADYVLIMTGAVNDDLGISTHFARIGNSVFPDHCGDKDPNCNKFGFHGNDQNQPTPMMKQSLVYNLYKHGGDIESAKADPERFELVWKSRYDQLRIFKVLNVSEESRRWVSAKENLLCDAPGSWYCVGQYPPALGRFLKLRNNFAQVEDFNKKGEQSAYTKMIEEKRRKGEL